MITNPIILHRDSILADADKIMATYRVSGLPIVEDDGTLVGIITNRDLKYRKDLQTNSYPALLFLASVDVPPCKYHTVFL